MMKAQKMSDDVQPQGRITLTHRDSDGNIKNVKHIKNVVTDSGKAGVAKRIAETETTTPYDWIAIGTDSTSASSSDTSLGSEITSGGGSRTQDGTTTTETTSVTDDTAVVDVTFDFTSSFGVEESGLFDASSGGTMLARQTFSTINVSNGDSLTVTWKIQVS